MATYRSKWHLRFQASLNPGGYDDIIRKVETEGLFANWSRVWDPGDLAATYLSLIRGRSVWRTLSPNIAPELLRERYGCGQLIRRRR